MDAADLQIRRLATAEAATYRGIRLEALRQNPEAFSSTFAFEDAQPLAWFAERLETSGVFGAFHDGELLGIAGFFGRTDEKEAHKGVLWGMYVRSGARRTGVGRRLVEAVIDFARDRVELIQLAVFSENHAARRLYASLGFLEFGLERKALKHNGRYYDEVWMAKDIAPRACHDSHKR